MKKCLILTCMLAATTIAAAPAAIHAQTGAALPASSATRMQTDSHPAGKTHTATTPDPATDAAAQASPASATSKPPADPATDAAANQSPVSPIPAGTAFRAHTALTIRMSEGASSANAHNGQHLRATLVAAVRTSNGATIRAGSPVTVTVLAAAPAGKIESAGELSLQIVRVGKVATLSEAIEIHGRDGHKDLPDSAPAKGTEASVSAGTTLHTTVAPVPL